MFGREGACMVLLAKGFRPFFFLATFTAILWPVGWVMRLTSGTGEVAWHAHEMVFGYTGAVIAGFLLTAVENWTQRPTLRGGPLFVAAALWCVARLGMGWGTAWGASASVLVWLVVAVGIGRPILHTGNRRNVPLLGLVGGLGVLNAWMHLGGGLGAARAALALIVAIIVLITGRIVPLFTRNATGDAAVVATPRRDRAALLLAVGWGLAEVWGVPEARVLAVAVGVVAMSRIPAWWTRGVASRPLLAVLHAGHASVALGLMLEALVWTGLPVGTGPLHILTIGGLGGLTLGMMARVSLGHTGRALRADRWMTAAFVALFVAAGVRGVGPMVLPARVVEAWWLSAWLWAGAFAILTVRFTPVWWSRRVDGKPG